MLVRAARLAPPLLPASCLNISPGSAYQRVLPCAPLQEACHHAHSASSCCASIAEMQAQADGLRALAADRFAAVSASALAHMRAAAAEQRPLDGAEARRLVATLGADAAIAPGEDGRPSLLSRVEAGVRSAMRHQTASPPAAGAKQRVGEARAAPTAAPAAVAASIERLDQRLDRLLAAQRPAGAAADDVAQGAAAAASVAQRAGVLADRADALRDRVQAMRNHVLQQTTAAAPPPPAAAASNAYGAALGADGKPALLREASSGEMDGAVTVRTAIVPRKLHFTHPAPPVAADPSQSSVGAPASQPAAQPATQRVPGSLSSAARQLKESLLSLGSGGQL